MTRTRKICHDHTENKEALGHRPNHRTPFHVVIRDAAGEVHVENVEEREDEVGPALGISCQRGRTEGFSKLTWQETATNVTHAVATHQATTDLSYAGR